MSTRRVDEPFLQKAWRISKENPWVPAGTLATTGAFSMSVVRWRQKDSKSLNKWLRARVGFHFLTIIACVWGMYSVGQSNLAKEQAGRHEELVARERREFAERLRLAEEEVAAAAALQKSEPPAPIPPKAGGGWRLWK